jgi:hypothetical protein
MARTKFLELPEELSRAIESAASAQGQTVAQWLAGKLPLASQTEEAQEPITDDDKEEAVARRDLWLMQL